MGRNDLLGLGSASHAWETEGEAAPLLLLHPFPMADIREDRAAIPVFLQPREGV